MESACNLISYHKFLVDATGGEGRGGGGGGLLKSCREHMAPTSKPVIKHVYNLKKCVTLSLETTKTIVTMV